MRKLAFALLILPMFVACNQKELKQLKEQNTQLTTMAKEKEATINNFVDAMKTIEENLAIIKQKEQIIAVDAQENINQSQREKITSDITLINNLLAQNKSDLADLDKKLKNSYYKNSKLRKLVEGLKKEMEEKETNIVALNDQVAQLNVEVENLNGNVAQLNTTVDSLNTENDNRTQIIEEQTTDLNTAYFVTGSAKELQEKQVLVKEGGLLGLGKSNKLSKDFNAQQFQKIDITKTMTIPVSGKKISLVTSHPSDSYKIEGTEKNVESITIIKPEDFWKASKYLVVAVK